MLRIIVGTCVLFVGVSMAQAQEQAKNQTGFSEGFKTFNPQDWQVAHYDFSHPHFDTDWRRENLSLSDGLKLGLTPHVGLNQFAGASIRRRQPSHYGWYEAKLKAARGAGVVTGFFLYTGPAYGTQHDEIDWEFFGQDTKTAQVAWFKAGELTNHKIDLGFDAADVAATYAIDWYPDRIDWYIDGKKVFTATENIPQTPQMVFANVWAVAPELSEWAGLADPTKSSEATVSHISSRFGR